MKQVKQQKAKKVLVKHVGLFTETVELFQKLAAKAPALVELVGPSFRVSVWLTVVVGVMVLVAEVLAK